jgi:Flp pilus assembly protein TadG
MLRKFLRSAVSSLSLRRTPGANAVGRSAQSHLAVGVRHDTRGASAIEFAIIAPVFLAIVVGALKFGVAVSNRLLLNNGAAEGAMALALSRGTTAPYTTTTTAVTNGAGSLTSSSITVTVSINGSACTTDSSCASALTAGATGKVTATYPCDLTVMGVNYKGSSCSLSATSSVMIQ